MSTALRLPAHFLTTASYWNERKNPYRSRVETGGYLVADPNTPDKVRFATGPGKDSQHEYAELVLSREDVEAAVEAAGYMIVGDWHTHPAGSDVDPSPPDRESWVGELKRSPTLEGWAGVILLRDDQRWVGGSGWDTRWRNGAYRTDPATITPDLTTARDLARDLAWTVNRSSLVDQDTWIADPSRLHLDLPSSTRTST